MPKPDIYSCYQKIVLHLQAQLVNEKVPPFSHVFAGQTVGGGWVGATWHKPHKNGHAFWTKILVAHDSRVNRLHLESSCWHANSAHSGPL